MGSSAQPRSVGIVIANYNGAEHLPACLDSIAELEYDGRLETVVVDNASSDESVALIRNRYPWARIVEQADNLGFAGATNAGVRAVDTDVVAFVNNDMRVARSWLAELVARFDPANGVPCVAGLILDWDGVHVDFADGYVTAQGLAGQLCFGLRRERVPIDDGRALPFACGGSMLIDRALFLELGGFDDAFFALLEDVDLGWRLRLAGHDVRLAATAVSYHRHGATLATLPSRTRRTLVERNALRMLLKNVGDKNLVRLLAPALALFSAREAPPEALAQVLADGPAIAAERERVQAARTRSDEELFSLFGRPFLPAANDERYLALSAMLTRSYRLDELFARRRATTLLVIGDDARLRRLAEAVAPLVRVVYAAPTRVAIDGVEALVLREPTDLADEADVVIDATTAMDADELIRLLLDPPTLGPPEDEQLLLARRRRARGVGQPPHERLARTLWSTLPIRLRRLGRT